MENNNNPMQNTPARQPYQHPGQTDGGNKTLYILLGAFAGIVIFIALGAFSCSMAVGSLFKAAGDMKDFNFETIADTFDEDSDEWERVGVVEVKGAIFDSKKPLQQLRNFENSSKIKAIVVRIDSPGGSVGPSQEIFREIRKVRDAKTVVISMGAMAASGGFYIAMAGEKIYAMPGTITGSIGVISEFTYVKDLLNWMKLKPKVYKSGKFKDASHGLRELTPEDDKLFQGLIDDIYEQFLSDVAKGRSLKVEDVRPIADGRILTAAQAKKLKLIDEYGNLYDAADGALKLAGINKKARLVYPRKDKEEFLMELFNTASVGIFNLLNISPKKPAMTMLENRGF